MGYWPPLQKDINGREIGLEGFLLAKGRVCHRCGKNGGRAVICAFCELVVCAKCSSDHFCLECARNQKREAV